MSSLSGCTLVRNAVKLRYPLEASILTYYPLCDEVVISYDPQSEDDTEQYIQSLARKYPKIRPVPSPWNLDNHQEGTEITIQSNVAVDACSSEWVLYVQADEAIHEGDHEALRAILERRDVNGVLFDRRSFLRSLDREIPEYFARDLLRLYRNGEGCVVGDGMTCGLAQGIRPSVPRQHLRMFNYSRMGDREEVLLRSRYRDNFHIASPDAIEANVQTEFTQSVRPFDAMAHPSSIRQWYGTQAVANPAVAAPTSPVTLALLMGPGEREHLMPFFWQFRQWPGDIVVFDDMTVDGGSSILGHILKEVLKLPEDRYSVIRDSLAGDFGKARNLLQEAARAPWVLTTAPDERWDVALLNDLPKLTSQLERDGKIICGFPRANVIDGVLVNDLPDSEWTETGLMNAHDRMAWPPQNGDIQYRLMKKEERWVGRIHEQPERLSKHPDRVVVLRDFWILHNKTLGRQRGQDGFYKSLGQKRGMPSAPQAVEAPHNLREETLKEVVNALPQHPLIIVETGTLRDASPAARLSDGWSTYTLAQALADRAIPESRLYSIDIEPAYIETSKKAVPSALHPWVSWVCRDARLAIRELDVPRIDLLYLDSSDDPAEIMEEFECALPKLTRESVVVVDDTGPYHAGPDGKGTVILPKARAMGWTVERRDNSRCHMAVLRREVSR